VGNVLGCFIEKADNHILACNFAKYSLILIFFSLADSAALPCNILLIACFLKLKFHKVVWQHMQGVVGFSVTFLLQKGCPMIRMGASG